MANDVLEAHRAGRVRVAIGRSSDYYGPRGTASTTGENLFKPAVRGKKTRWLGSLDQPHTLNYLEDMARALATLGERAEADGEVWHLPAAEPLTGRRFLELVFEAAGQRPRIGWRAGRWSGCWGCSTRGCASSTRRCISSSARSSRTRRSSRRPSGRSGETPHPEAIARTVAWFRTYVR